MVLILGALRLAVSSGRAFFPITCDVISEFSKQTRERFDQTMSLVEQLSLGVSMIPHPERMALEMEQFMGTVRPMYPPEKRPIWTSFAFSFGYKDLQPPGMTLGPHVLTAMAETAWNAQPSLLAKSLDLEVFEAREESRALAERLNELNQQYAEDVTSHEVAVRMEIDGAAELLRGVAAREFRRLAKAAGQIEADDVAKSQSAAKSMSGIVAQGLQKPENQRRFGSLFVPAMLHAAVRSERNRKIKPNDIFDFRHAAAALPYCKAFLTDRSLATLIGSGHVALDQIYDCKIASSPETATEIILDLVGA